MVKKKFLRKEKKYEEGKKKRSEVRKEKEIIIDYLYFDH